MKTKKHIVLVDLEKIIISNSVNLVLYLITENNTSG